MSQKCEKLQPLSVFGQWTVVEDHVKVKGKQGMFVKCVCSCGTQRLIKRHDLIDSKTTSCGCQRSRLSTEHLTRHGDSSSRLYCIWKGMKKRCNNRNTPAYKNYGGRGISYCKEWEVYEAFKLWAVNNGYEENLTIERINVDSSYCPENCAWIPRKKQANNTRCNNRVEAFSEIKNITEWENDPRCPVKADTIRKRLNRGYSGQRAVEEIPANRATPLLM